MRSNEKAPLMRRVKYIVQGACASLNPFYRKNDEFGRCSICGNYTRFKYNAFFLSPDSAVAVSCGWDEQFVREINTANTLNCKYCGAKFRVRCAADSMLRYFWEGKIRSVAELMKKLRAGEMDASWRALEATATGGIFSGFGDLKNVVRSEYFDDVKRGSCKDGIRSEDLQSLTFDGNTFDAVIALDVFEHIADPWKAFAEVTRVLKPGGAGIITFPLDARVKNTRRIAEMVNGKINYFARRAYHNDPLRKEGSPVFTKFGTDIQEKLKGLGYNVSCDIHRARRTRVDQSVFMLIK